MLFDNFSLRKYIYLLLIHYGCIYYILYQGRTQSEFHTDRPVWALKKCPQKQKVKLLTLPFLIVKRKFNETHKFQN